MKISDSTRSRQDHFEYCMPLPQNIGFGEISMRSARFRNIWLISKAMGQQNCPPCNFLAICSDPADTKSDRFSQRSRRIRHIRRRAFWGGGAATICSRNAHAIYSKNRQFSPILVWRSQTFLAPSPPGKTTYLNSGTGEISARSARFRDILLISKALG